MNFSIEVRNMDIKKCISLFENGIEEMSLNPEFDFKLMPHMPYKLREMFDEVYYDLVCPLFFAVIRHAKYPIDNQGAYRASFDLQTKAYKKEDFRYEKLQDSWGGSAKYCKSFEEAEQYLKDIMPKYFKLEYQGGKTTSEEYVIVPREDVG